jgi:hypothetical protein
MKEKNATQSALKAISPFFMVASVIYRGAEKSPSPRRDDGY